MRRVFLIVCALWAVSLYSQTDTASIKNLFEMSLEELMQIEVVSASRISQKANEAPATIYVVNEVQIEQRGYSCLMELLDDIPQVEIQWKSESERGEYWSFNGTFGVEKIVILVDGLRANSVTGTELRLAENYPLMNVKQVEVLLGPASSLYGADAFTGIINIITKTGYENKGIHFTSSYGMFNTSDNELVIGLGNKDLSLSVSGKYYHSDEPFMPDYYPEWYSWYDHYEKTGEMLLWGDTVQTSPIKKWETPTDAYAIQTRLKYKNLEVGYSNRFSSHSSSTGIPPEIYIYSKDAVYATQIQDIYAKHQLIGSKFQLFSTISGQQYRVLPKSKFLNQYAGYIDAYKYERNRVLKIEEQLNYFINKRMNLVAGLSYQYCDVIPKTSDLPLQYDESKKSDEQKIYFPGTNFTTEDGTDLTIYQDIIHFDYYNVGSYLQFQGNFTDKIALTTGIRYDYNSRYGSTVNPRIGLIYRPLSKLTFKILYGHAYLAPSPYKSHSRYGSFYPVTDEGGNVTGLASGFWHVENPDLSPETRKSLELNLAYQINSDILVSMHGFYSLVDNLLRNTGYSDRTFHDIPVGYLENYINEGNSTTYGITTRFDYKKSFDGGFGIDCYGAYTFIDGDVEGKDLYFTAKHTLKTGLGLRYKNFNVFTKYNYRGKSYSIVSTKENPVFAEPMGYMNLNANYLILNKPKFKLSVFTYITNLLNSRYYNTGGDGDCRVPQDPIRINIGLRFGI